MDLQTELNQLIGESLSRQEEVLELIHQRIAKNYMKLDFNYRFELAELVLILKENSDQKFDKIADKNQMNALKKTDRNIKIYCLRILHFIYGNKWLNDIKS